MESRNKNAKLFDCLICLEMDANAKVGCDIIKNDPNQMSGNGQMLLDLVSRNNLVIGNSTDLCDGTITRKRKTVNGIEESVLDYFVMCQELFLLLCSMKIDETRSLVLSRYSKANGKCVVTPSDHNVLYCKFNLRWCNTIYREQKKI